MRPIALATAPTAVPFGKVKAGDVVSVRLKDGKRERFVVHRIEGDELVSAQGARYRSTDVLVLQRRSFSPVKTIGLAAGIYVGIGLLAVLAAPALILNAAM